MCGLAGAFGVPDAAYVVSLMLKQLQHRGQEAAGIVAGLSGEPPAVQPGPLRLVRGFGLVDEVFGHLDFARDLPGTAAIGHVRYSTSAASDDLHCVQPFLWQSRWGPTAIVHNGNLTNYPAVRARLENEGTVFLSESDTGLFPHLLSRSGQPAAAARIVEVLREVEGAASLLLLSTEGLCAATDPWGFRPLVWAPYKNGALFASETCALDLFGIDHWSEVPPGGLVEASCGDGVVGRRYTVASRNRHCSFCHIYFSKPDSAVFGQSVAAVRERLGARLATRRPVRADLVTPVPDSSNTVALAYAHALGLPFAFALVRNHYTGRTFITPRQAAREFGVRMKLNAVRHLVAGRSVAVVDDSVVRGTTSRKVASLLREAGAREVHLRVASPPVIHPCYWGIDTPQRDKLVAAVEPPESLAQALGVDSVGYLEVEDLLAGLGDPEQLRHCLTCFTGRHPTADLEKPDF